MFASVFFIQKLIEAILIKFKVYLQIDFSKNVSHIETSQFKIWWLFSIISVFLQKEISAEELLLQNIFLLHGVLVNLHVHYAL